MALDRRSPTVPAIARWGIAAAAVLAIVMVAGPTVSAGAADDARDQAARGDLRGALARADDAIALSPQDAGTRLLRANLLADLGRPAQSDAAFAAAVARSPRDWQVYADWASALARRGDVRGARVAVRRAIALNPLEQRPRIIEEALRG